MNFNNLLKSFDTNDYFDALMKYGRIFVYKQDNYIFFFRQLYVAEIETFEKIIRGTNMYLISEIEDWIVTKAVLYIEDGTEKKDDYVWDTDNLPSHIVSSLAYTIIYHSYSPSEEQVIYDIENSKQQMESILDIPMMLALRLNPTIDKLKTRYDELVKLAALKDMEYEMSIAERYEEARQDAIKKEAELKSKGVK